MPRVTPCPYRRASAAALALLPALLACSATATIGDALSSTPSPNEAAPPATDAGTSGTGSAPQVDGNAAPPPVVTPDAPDAGGQAAVPASTDLPLVAAPPLPAGLTVTANRSSVILSLPGVPGAHDYRVFAVEPGVAVSVTVGREHVAGGTLHCAGLRQRNQCDDGEVLPVTFNNELLDLPHCTVPGVTRRPNVPTSLMQTIEVDGITAATTLVVEAIDRQCPFPGLFGPQHRDVKITGVEMPGTTENVTVNGVAHTIIRWPTTFPVRTEAEIRAQYDSMILNGQGPNGPTLDPTSPDFPESPYIRLAQPAPPNDPVVLARSVITVAPLAESTPPAGFTTSGYFDDFDDPTDQPTFLRNTDYLHTFNYGTSVNVFQTKKWVFYDVGNAFSDFFVDRGQLNMVMGDPAQDSMSVQAMYPKRPVQLPSAPNTFLHVTYEVQRNETGRRYENFTLCGSDQVGQTYDGTAPKSAPLPRPGFMNEDETTRTSPLGWNCLYLVPRGSGYEVLPGGDVSSHSDSSVKLTVVKTHPAPRTFTDYDGQHITSYASAFGPTQDSSYPKRWERQIDDTKTISAPWLDDQLNTWQKAKFDVYVRRDKVVVYVNNQQRLCSDISASALTMAEGALGFWHILYHTSAEFTEIRNGDATAVPVTGQHHILHNTPFADQRSWDNVGFQENATLPSTFDPGRCL